MDVLKFECSSYIITISTNNQIYAWERFSRRVPDAMTYCDYTSSQEGLLYLCDPQAGYSLRPIEQDTALTIWEERFPILFETCKYQFAIDFKNLYPTSKPPRIVHTIRSINESFRFYPSGEKSGVLVGNIDFLNSPGTFKFTFEYRDQNDSIKRDYIELYVASPKLDTKNDLRKITSLINEEYENYVFDYLTLTFNSLSIKRAEKSNDIIWLSIFKGVIDDYIKNVKYIISRPNNRAVRTTFYSRPERIKFWTPQQEEKYKNLGKDAELHQYRHTQIESTINTKENRFVKYTLHSLIKKTKLVYSHILCSYKDIDIDERKESEKFIRTLQQIHSSSFFKRIGDFEGFKQESIILQQRAGYSNIYKDWIILKSSLDLIEGKTDIGMKKIWELYEIWCFLVMKRLIAKVLNLDLKKDKDYIKESLSTILNAFLDSSQSHVVEFRNPNNGDIVYLEYQRTYNRKSHSVFSPTTEQRPDIVLTIKKENKFTLTYLYDAKYRVLDDINTYDSGSHINLDIADYPVPDAINQMHRYRDAIYYSMKDDCNPTDKEIVGGYILYPARIEGTKIEDCYFYKSIEKVNIGAFPVLPTNDPLHILQSDLLEQHLDYIINKKTISEHIGNSIPQKGLKYITSEALEQTKSYKTNAIVVTLSKELQKWITTHHKLFIPIDEIYNSSIMQVEFIYLFSTHEWDGRLFMVERNKYQIWSKKDFPEEVLQKIPGADREINSFFIIDLIEIESKGHTFHLDFISEQKEQWYYYTYIS